MKNIMDEAATVLEAFDERGLFCGVARYDYKSGKWLVHASDRWVETEQEAREVLCASGACIITESDGKK